MSNVELTNINNAVAIYSQSEMLKEKIIEWIYQPSTYGDQAQSSFVQSINRYASDTIMDIANYVNSLKRTTLRAIAVKRNRDIASLNANPPLIAKSLGCGTLGGLASM